MKVQLILLLVASSFVQGSPLHERNSKGFTRHKANEEVRSIISAIVDAILDGDRKRRSEVVDFDDESTHDATHNNVKVNEAQDETMKRRKFTKRQEGEDEDNSVPLANVMATSDVNSTEDQNEIFKKDIIEHVDDKHTFKNVLKESQSVNEYEKMKNKAASEEISEIQLPRFLYGIINGKEASSSRNDVEKSHKTSAEQGFKMATNDKKKKINNKEGTIGKDTENNNKKSNKKEKISPESSHAKKINKKTSQKTKDISIHSDSKKHNDERAVPESYSEFLKIAETPNPLIKHESIQHVRDDSEMNEDPSVSEKSTKLQESEDTMDTDEEKDSSETERNDDKDDEEDDDPMESNDNDHDDGPNNQGDETDNQDDSTSKINDHDGETNNKDGKSDNQDSKSDNQDYETDNQDDKIDDKDDESDNDDADNHDTDNSKIYSDDESTTEKRLNKEKVETEKNLPNSDDMTSTSDREENKDQETTSHFKGSDDETMGSEDDSMGSEDHSQEVSEDESGSSQDDGMKSIEESDGSTEDTEGSQYDEKNDLASGSADELNDFQVVSGGLQQDSKEKQRDSKKTQQESNGSKEDSNGTQDSKEEQKDSKEMQQNSHGSQPDSNGSQQDSNGSKQDSNGSQKDSNGSKEDSNGSQQDSNGSQPDSNGSQQDSNGSQQDSNGSKQDSNGSKQDSKGSKQDSNGSKGDSNRFQQNSNGSKPVPNVVQQQESIGLRQDATGLDSKEDSKYITTEPGISGDDSSSTTEDGSSSTTEDGSSSTTEDGSSSTTEDGSSSTTEDGSSSTTEDGSSSTTEDGSSSTTEDGSSSVTEDGAEINANDMSSGSADIEEDGSTGNSEVEASSYKESSQGTPEKNKKVISNNINNEASSGDDDTNDGQEVEQQANQHEVNNDVDSKQSKNIDENDSMDTGSSSEDSNYNNKARNEDENDDHNNKQKMLKIISKTKHGAASTSINDVQSLEPGRNKNKEVKPEASGKIIETSYRFNDEDTPEEDDFTNQANNAWTGSSNQDPVLIGDDTPDLIGEGAGIALDENPQAEDNSRLVTNVPIGGNDLYEDSLNKPTPDLKQWGHDKMQTPTQSNDYNWMENGLVNNQEPNLETIQDRLQDYQNAEWNGRETPYFNKGQRREYQTTEQPELEKRTSIPNGNKLSKPAIKSQHYTAPADAFTDNDVFGYAGSIGPFLQKRNFIPHKLGEPSETTKKDDILESLMTDVNEPWIKKFLTKTLEMAVNGDKETLRSEKYHTRQNEDLDFPELRRDKVNDLESKPRKETTEQDDAMPLDATNNKDELDEQDDRDEPAIHSTKKSDYSSDDDENNKQKEKTAGISDDLNEVLTTHENVPDIAPESKMEGMPLSEVVKHIPKSKSPVADIGTIPSHGNGPIKSIIRITARVPANPSPSMPEQMPLNPQELDPFQISPPQLTSSQPPRSSPEIIPSTPKLPELVPLEPPQNVPTMEPNIPLPPFTDNQSPKPAQMSSNNQIVNPDTPIPPKQDLTSSNQAEPLPQQQLTSSNLAAPAVIGPIIKVITSPGRTVTVKDGKVNKENEKIQAELSNALNNSIQNIGISSANDLLENTIKEAELINVLKDAIPVNQRRPVGTEDDLKRGLDDLKDYAVALTEAKALSRAQRNGVVEKLARDLLDEMRVMDERKQKLLNELMSFVTAMEVSTFKERLKEIKSQIIGVSSQNPDDTAKIRLTAIKLLDELFEELPLPKDRIEKTEKQIVQSKLLKSLIKEGEKRVLRSKLKKALTDLVADKLL